MKNLESLGNLINITNLEMDKISVDIKTLEEKLKSSCFPSFVFDIGINESIEWDADLRRLKYYSLFEEKPLLETKIATRKKCHVFLDNFIDALIEFVNRKGQ